VSDLHAQFTAADYVDADRYALECERVLAAGWLPLCREDQLAHPGDRIALTLLGRPLLAVRDSDAVRVLGNVCAHRGSTIVEDGASAGSTVVCPSSPSSPLEPRASYRVAARPGRR